MPDAFTIHKPDGSARVGITLDDVSSGGATVVKRTAPGSLAEASGIPIGAEVLTINGERVTDMEQGANLIKAAAGVVRIEVRKSTQQQPVPANLTPIDISEAAVAAPHDNDAEEMKAEAELQAALAAAAAAPPTERIGGLGEPGTRAMIAFDVKGVTPRPAQYAFADGGPRPGEKPLVLIYLAIRGLGETARLLLAEAGAAYTHLASPMGEPQHVACEWRQRSPNGLCPMLSGLGVPRASPISQSGTIVRFLSRRYGLAGRTELDGLRADVLYETAKDLAKCEDEIREMARGCVLDSGAKGPAALAGRIEKQLEIMPSPSDGAAALNFGQIEVGGTRRPITFAMPSLACTDATHPSPPTSPTPHPPPSLTETEYFFTRRPACPMPHAPCPIHANARAQLFTLLVRLDEYQPGLVGQLSPKLEAFRAAAAARPRIAAYLSSALRFPPTCAELGKRPGPGGWDYGYAEGRKQRATFALA
jgi:hypothetical protein